MPRFDGLPGSGAHAEMASGSLAIQAQAIRDSARSRCRAVHGLVPEYLPWLNISSCPPRREHYRCAAETAPKSASRRVRHGRETGCLRLTPASVALFRASGDTPEKTGTLGWGTRIRTLINGVRVRDSTVENVNSKYAVISERYLAAHRGFELRTAT